jgi:hypothetical protein
MRTGFDGAKRRWGARSASAQHRAGRPANPTPSAKNRPRRFLNLSLSSFSDPSNPSDPSDFKPARKRTIKKEDKARAPPTLIQNRNPSTAGPGPPLLVSIVVSIGGHQRKRPLSDLFHKDRAL